jgi:serine/threonine protein kinase
VLGAEEHDGAGTPMYQAPEILRNSGVGLPSDVFSFGIIMWEIISGEIAYEVQQNLEKNTLPEIPNPF